MREREREGGGGGNKYGKPKAFEKRNLFVASKRI